VNEKMDGEALAVCVYVIFLFVETLTLLHVILELGLFAGLAKGDAAI